MIVVLLIYDAATKTNNLWFKQATRGGDTRLGPLIGAYNTNQMTVGGTYLFIVFEEVSIKSVDGLNNFNKKQTFKFRNYGHSKSHFSKSKVPVDLKLLG